MRMVIINIRLLFSKTFSSFDYVSESFTDAKHFSDIKIVFFFFFLNVSFCDSVKFESYAKGNSVCDTVNYNRIGVNFNQ